MNQYTTQVFHQQRISYACFGDPDGQPAFYFHGLPGSRYEAEFLHSACQRHGINLIAPDRFGYGDSSPSTENRYRYWADCIQTLADKLGFARFYLFAHSGGGPYALACASLLKTRVIATGICSGLGPLVQPELRARMQTFTSVAIWLARFSPWLLKLSYGYLATLAARFFSSAAITFLGIIDGEPDKTTITRTDNRQRLARNMKCAFTQGPRGAIEDLIAANQSWPFELEEINPLFLWAGDRDRVVPLSHSEWIYQHIPHARLERVAGEGHFSLPFNYPEQIITTVIGESVPGPEPARRTQ